jgi:O-antigen ligase
VPPHNFLLEIMLAYGVVGLLLWLAIWVAPLRAAARALGIFSTPVVLCGTSLGVVAATAFFQPLMVNPTILFCCYFVAGVLVSASRERGVGDRLGRHRVSRRGGLRMRPRLAGRSAG